MYDKIRQRFDSNEVRDGWDGGSTEHRLVLFGQFFKLGALDEERAYRQGPQTIEEVTRLFTTYQDMLNMDHANAAGGELSLIFFRDTVEHVSRVARALALPRGNVLMVGLGGSGKRTVAQFAGFLAGFTLQRIDLVRGYGRNEFREDLKRAFRSAGVSNRRTALLLSDGDLVDEVFLDDLNSIFNTGQLPGLFSREELEKIMGDVRPSAVAKGFPDTHEGLMACFYARCDQNLRILLALSPSGDKFRERVRQFPALTNSCIIDWFGEWPQDALHSVADKVLREALNHQSLATPLENMKVNRLPPARLGTTRSAQKEDDLYRRLAPLCVEFHVAVVQTCARFIRETKRHYYITPKTYIDTLRLYVRLLGDTIRSNAAARDRLAGGVTKLKDTNANVRQMEQELHDLQPVLKERYAETQRLMVEVAAEQKEAEQIQAAVLQEEEDAKVLALEAQQLRDEAQADLDEVTPAMEAAVEALNALNKQGERWLDSRAHLPRGSPALLLPSYTQMSSRSSRSPSRPSWCS